MTRASLLLQMYYSVIDDIHFHQSQLSFLEERASQLETNILNYYNHINYPVNVNSNNHRTFANSPPISTFPFSLPNFSRSRRRSRHFPTQNERTETEQEESPNSNANTNPTRPSDTPSNPTNQPHMSTNNSNHIRSAINQIINSATTESGSSTANSNSILSSSFPYISSSTNRVTEPVSPFTYVGTFDIPLDRDHLSTSYTRSMLNRSSLSPLPTDSLSDSGAMLMYFMLESFANGDRTEEQHGIENPSSYITDLKFGDVEQPANTCCPIRMDVFTEETEISQINKCKHLFCREEIRKWLETHHTCPLCRTAIDN